MSKTISAKYLRQNLQQVLEEASRGEEITVIYRSTPKVKISATDIAKKTYKAKRRKDFIYALSDVKGIAGTKVPKGKEKEYLRKGLLAKYGTQVLS